MSIGVQLVSDIKPQSGPIQGADSSNTEGSGEFSNLMDEVSAEGRGDYSEGSDSSADRKEQGAEPRRNGKENPPDGNDLPVTEATGAEQGTDESSTNFSASILESEDTVPLNVIEQIYDAESEIETSVGPSVNTDTSNEAKESNKPQLPMNGLLLQAQNEGEEVVPTDDLPDTQLNQAQLNILANPVETERRRIGLGSVKEGAGDLLGLRTADVASAGDPPDLGNTQAGKTLTEQTGLTPNTLRPESIEGVEAEAEAAIFERGVKNASEITAGQDLPRKADLEAMLKELVATVPKETNGTSSLTGSPSAMATGIGSPLGSLQAATGASQTAALAGGNQLLSLSTAVTDQSWANDFAVRIRTLVSGNVQQATLNLNPAELGAIEVNLTTEGNETKAQFSVQNAVVRDALEASMPRLREIFQESGLSLTDTDVRDQSMSQQANDQNSGGERNTNSAESADVFFAGEQNGLPEDDSLLARWDGDQLSGGIDTYT